MYKISTLFFASVFSLLFFQNATAQSVFRINGIVKESLTSNIVEGAQVILISLNKSVQTDKAGYFSIEYTGTFDGTLHIKKEGFLEFDYIIQAKDINASTPVIIELNRDLNYNSRVTSTGSIPTISIDEESG